MSVNICAAITVVNILFNLKDCEGRNQMNPGRPSFTLKLPLILMSNQHGNQPFPRVMQQENGDVWINEAWPQKKAFANKNVCMTSSSLTFALFLSSSSSRPPSLALWWASICRASRTSSVWFCSSGWPGWWESEASSGPSSSSSCAAQRWAQPSFICYPFIWSKMRGSRPTRYSHL